VNDLIALAETITARLEARR
jgi:nicotinamide-nucleotide amidase